MVLLERLRTRPNVCIVVVDSLRAGALSQVAGAAKTPHIQALMSDGVQFRRAYSHSPAALPAHASLFTGRLPSEVGVAQDGLTFSGDVDLLAKTLSRAGYETHGIVSLPALNKPAAGAAVEQGFDSWTQGDGSFTNAAAVSSTLNEHFAEIDEDQPFLLFAQFADPHEPYDANDSINHKANVLWRGELLETVLTSKTSFIEHTMQVPPGAHMFDIVSETPFRMREYASDAPNRVTVRPRPSDLDNDDGDIAIMIDNSTQEFQEVTISAWLHDLPNLSESRARYRHEVEAVDAAIGKLVAELKRRGVYDNTLIVLTADHGEALGEHDTLGHGTTLYDEALHIPLVLKLPKECKLETALFKRTGMLARLIDIAPTILNILELSPLRGATGSSLAQVEKRILIAETHAGTPLQSIFCMRDNRYKLIYHLEGSRFEMYDLAQDPSELDDVFRTQGHLLAEWQHELKNMSRRAP